MRWLGNILSKHKKERKKENQTWHHFVWMFKMIDSLIDFNSMSTRLELFYT